MLTKKMQTKSNRIKDNGNDKKYLKWLGNSGVGCIVCGDTNIELHHITDKSIKGLRRHDRRVVPLCTEHHRGDGGVHHGNVANLSTKDMLFISKQLNQRYEDEA